MLKKPLLLALPTDVHDSGMEVDEKPEERSTFDEEGSSVAPFSNGRRVDNETLSSALNDLETDIRRNGLTSRKAAVK